MNSKDFNELVEARCNKIKSTLASKGKEYSTDDDKLHNFNKAGVRSGQSREKALMGMKLKHEISIDDILNKIDSGVYPSIEVIDEKIGDTINYLILLEACLVDRLKYNKTGQDLRGYPLTPVECFKESEYEGIYVCDTDTDNYTYKVEYLSDGKVHITRIETGFKFVILEYLFQKFYSKKVEDNPSKFLEGQIFMWNGDTTKIYTYKIIGFFEDSVILQQLWKNKRQICLSPNLKEFKENYTLWKEDS